MRQLTLLCLLAMMLVISAPAPTATGVPIAIISGPLGGSSPSLHFSIVQLGTCPFAYLPGWLAVQEAQRQIARADPAASLATAVDQPTWDTIHYTAAGYRTIGDRLADAVLAEFYGLPVDALTELVEIRHGADDATLQLVYDGEVSGGAPVLFRAVDSLGSIGPVAVTTTNACRR